MIWRMFEALFLFTIPVSFLTYMLLGLMMKRGHLGAFVGQSDLGKQLKASRKEHKKALKKNLFLGKWVQFGGGFYGLAAFYTYVWIEIGEAIQLIIKFSDPANWTFDITISLLIGFIINAVTNLITAFLWIFYWPPSRSFVDIAIWVALAYLGYIAGSYYAQRHYVDDCGHMDYWRWWNREMEGKK